MEYRAVIHIHDFPTSPQNELGFDLLEWLADHTDMGPVMTGPGPDDRTGATVTLATDAPDEAAAARDMLAAVTHGLEAVGLGHLYPARVELEPVADEAPVVIA